MVLVSRNPHKLQSTSNEIWEQFGKETHVKIVVIDFEKIGGQEIEVTIRKETEGLDVGVLVNSVVWLIKVQDFFVRLIWEGLMD